MQNSLTEELLYPNKGLPLVLDMNQSECEYYTWCLTNQESIESNILKHGSIIFRNFGINSVLEFEKLAELLCPSIYEDYGDLPPSGASNRIYGATPYPADSIIHFHNESSHTSKWPMRQFFYSAKVADEGGELRVVDGRTVLKALDFDIVSAFAEKGLVYERNFIPYFDVSWQDFYKTSNRAEVEAICRNDSVLFEWKGDVLSTRQIAPAIVVHPKTKEHSWFNQIQLHHPRMLDEELLDTLLSVHEESELPRNVRFGDGSAIPDAWVDTISQVLDQEAVAIKTNEGDVIYNDNILVAHSRLTYKGDRKVYVALADPLSWADLPTIEPALLEITV